MKNLSLCSVVASLAFGAGPALSEDSTTTAPSEAAKANIVCRNEAPQGTRIPVRICKTKQQIKEERQNAKEATAAFQRDGDFQLH
jgi:hypothetical protein